MHYSKCHGLHTHTAAKYDCHYSTECLILFCSETLEKYTEVHDLTQWFSVPVLGYHCSAHLVCLSYVTPSVQFMDLPPNELMI